MEKRGVPAMLIATDAFRIMAEFEAKSLGLPDVEVAIVKHPIVTKSREGLDADVEAIAGQVKAFFGLTAADGG